MSVFHVFKIVQLESNRAKHHIYVFVIPKVNCRCKYVVHLLLLSMSALGLPALHWFAVVNTGKN